MLLYKCLFCILGVISSLGNICCSEVVSKPQPTPYHDWDFLVFSQRWPITGCAQWEEAKQGNTCNLPTDKSLWIVHGIWPTKTGTDGPQFCPSAIHFDPDQLQPMMDDLKAYWTNIEANTKPYSFWKHEWAKHGTCASTLPELDSVTNFFSKGLEWNKQYKLSEILNQGKIVPGTEGYTIDQIYNAVKSFTKTEPIFDCVVDAQTKETMISEIHICFNKSLDLIDCGHSNSNNRKKVGVMGDCSSKKPIMYLQDVPTREISYEMDYVDDAFKQHFEEQLYYMSMYRFLKFLIWFTT